MLQYHEFLSRISGLVVVVSWILLHHVQTGNSLLQYQNCCHSQSVNGFRMIRLQQQSHHHILGDRRLPLKFHRSSSRIHKQQQQQRQEQSTSSSSGPLRMVVSSYPEGGNNAQQQTLNATMEPVSSSSSSSSSKGTTTTMTTTTTTGSAPSQPVRRPPRKKYQRKSIPKTERERRRLREVRQEQYEKIMMTAAAKSTSAGRDGGFAPPSIWSFESLFPKPVLDEKSIRQDLFGASERDRQVTTQRSSSSFFVPPSTTTTVNTNNEDNKLNVKNILRTTMSKLPAGSRTSTQQQQEQQALSKPDNVESDGITNAPVVPTLETADTTPTTATANNNTTTTTTIISEYLASSAVETNTSGKVDFALTRMVEDRIYGMRRDFPTPPSTTTNNGNDNGSSSSNGTPRYYSTSLMGDGAVQFRDGVRLGKPLRVNCDRLNYHAKREFRSNRLEEAQELYETAIGIDPTDGRAYLGLSRCAGRRRDFKLAREWLRLGISQSVSCAPDGTPDNGANPYLLQALGCLEEKSGHLSEAESLYTSAVKSRPSHAASWVALAQLRTKKFRQSASAGRICYQSAERELQKAGLPPSSFVYTAWAAMEYHKCGDVRRARQLFKAALTADKRCSAAWLQLGVMEANNQNWKEAELCFETVLKFDQRNTRVLQAYAIMESKRPMENSRKVIGLFERALKANPRDAGVLQAYALYVDKLGDVGAARTLLRRGTEINKRHAPVWQAWGVLETREGNIEDARHIFQQGIWACAQLTGNQSGGHSCARLWQAWGVLEASQGDHAAARRCFSRALDADNRNEATITAWALMEEELGNMSDARHLFERSLQLFSVGTEERKHMWRSYELMEQRCGNDKAAQEVYQRAMRESIISKTDADNTTSGRLDVDTSTAMSKLEQSQDDKPMNEVEVVRWDQGSSSMKAEVWLNRGSIEGRVPERTLKKMKGTTSSPTPPSRSRRR